MLCRQFCRGTVLIAFTRSEQIDDAELLELEELEVRELMNAYDLPGDTAHVCFDSVEARTRLPKGLSSIVKILNTLAPVDCVMGPCCRDWNSATVISIGVRDDDA